MVIRYAKEEIRQRRPQLFQSFVFLATHEALKPRLRTLDIVELFASADSFANDLIAHRATSHSLMQYDVEDLSLDLSDTNDINLLLILTLVKLHTMRRTHDEALAQTIRSLTLTLSLFCRRIEGYHQLLRLFIAKKHQLMEQGIHPPIAAPSDMPTAPKLCITPPRRSDTDLHDFIIEALHTESIETCQNIHTVLTRFNQSHKNLYENEETILAQKLDEWHHVEHEGRIINNHYDKESCTFMSGSTMNGAVRYD